MGLPGESRRRPDQGQSVTPGWTPIVNDYLPLKALTPGLKNTLWAISSFAVGDRTGCGPGHDAIARRAGCSRPTVSIHIKRLASLSVIEVVKTRRGYYYILPHKAKGVPWVASIARQVASLPPAVHEYKSLKQFLAEERAKPRFTARELRKVKADLNRWGEEEQAKGEERRGF